MNKLKLPALLALLLLMTGCFGGGVIHNKKRELEKFEFTSYSDADLKVITESASEKNPTKTEFETQWGKPDKIKKNKKETIWTYKTGTRWAGAVPMVGIGIPLAVPTGKNKIELYFEGDEERPFLAIIHYTSWSGGYYGPKDESSMEGGFNKLED